MRYHAQLVVSPLVPSLVQDRQPSMFSDVFTEESREISALDQNPASALHLLRVEGSREVRGAKPSGV